MYMPFLVKSNKPAWDILCCFKKPRGRLTHFILKTKSFSNFYLSSHVLKNYLLQVKKFVIREKSTSIYTSVPVLAKKGGQFKSCLNQVICLLFDFFHLLELVFKAQKL